jgi:hypothetical protein
VLHGLGLNYVQERIARRHYGIIRSELFEEGLDPPHLKYLSLDGRTKCRDVMDWFVSKVFRITTDIEKRERVFVMEVYLKCH